MTDLCEDVEFEVLTAVSTKMSTHRPDDGGSKDLWNVGKFLPDYTALQPFVNKLWNSVVHKRPGIYLAYSLRDY
jgi:hypothetical protein